MRKRVPMKTASILMCAMLAGTSVPVSPVLAAETETMTESATLEPSTGTQTPTETEGETDAPELVIESESETETEEPGIHFSCGDLDTSVVLDETASVQDFLSQMFTLLRVSQSADGVSLDSIDASGMRTVLLGGDLMTLSEMTVQDLYDMAAGSGLTLIAYNDQAELCRFTLTVAGDQNVDVKKLAVSTYGLTYDANGGTLNGASMSVRGDGDAISHFDATVSYDDQHRFLGWYDGLGEDAKEVTVETIVTSNMTLYAHWDVDSYTLSFDSQGGSAVDSQTLTIDDTLTELPVPTRDGYEFVGWFGAPDGGTKYDQVTLTSDLTLYAQWKAIGYQLNFETQGGTPVESLTGSVDMELTNFPTPVREGYVFEGWFDAATGGTQVISVTLTGDMTLFAHWTPAEYQLTFDSQGGSAVNGLSGSSETTLSDFPVPTRDGYTFDGWFDAATGGTQVTSINLTSDVTLYAHWTEAVPDTYVVTLDDQNGSVQNYTMNVGTAFTEFTTPSRNGYTFLGWFTSPDGGTQMTSYDGDTDVTFYAHWERVTETDPTDDNNTTVDDNNQNNGSTTENNQNGTTTPDDNNNPTLEGEENAVKRLTLTVISSTGTRQSVTVNDDVKLADLAEKLGYDVSTFTVRQASVEEYSVDGSTTMRTLADLTKNGDVLIIGYDASGKAIGSAKVVKTGNDTFTVTMSKDTDVALADANGNISEKGKGEGETESETSAPAATTTSAGKTDTVAEQVRTADTNTVPVYGALGALMAGLLSVVAIFRKKKHI